MYLLKKHLFKTTITIIIFTLLMGCENGKNPTSPNIKVYNAFGNETHFFIAGRTVYTEDEKSDVSENDSGYSNAWNAINFFHSDEIKNKKLFLTINKQSYNTKSDDEGYFEFNITSSQKLRVGYNDIALHIENNPNIYHGTMTTLASNKPVIGIISDIDDTVVISDVPHKTQLLLNTFWKNYKQREVVPTMVERYEAILSENSSATPSTLFFVSGSPKQLFEPIKKFLAYQNFPKHTTILKQIHGKEKDPLTDQIAYKISKIEKLIALYPAIKWKMFGDSGEKDLEVYTEIKKRYPFKVIAFYIRNVESGEIEEHK